MACIFSHPIYASTGTWTTTGYNLYKSAATGNTSSQTAVSAPGAVTITPVSMTNIAVGSVLSCDVGANFEMVSVTAVTGTTFTATFTKTHNVGFVIQCSALAPNWYGPWTPVSGYSNYTTTTDIYDPAGSKYDLYRVAPIVTVGLNSGIQLDMSRPFFPNETLYDSQLSALIENLRMAYLNDVPIPETDSTITTENTGMGTLPFVTDANTSRFYLSFLPNEDPVKFRESTIKVFLGGTGGTAQTASALSPYVDYHPNPDGGFVDFKVNPASSAYLKVEYEKVRFTDEECRNILGNSISALSHYGINGYELRQSNNLLYLVTGIPNRDLAEILCLIASRNMLSAQLLSSFETSEAWKDGKVEWTADPSRGIQAATQRLTDLESRIMQNTASYIVQNRTYPTRGEFDMFFSTTGSLPVYAMFFSQWAAFSWWI